VLRLLNASFPGRIHAHVGYSQETLKPFAQAAHVAGVGCDVATPHTVHALSAAVVQCTLFSLWL
jgi:hypothetical protein